MKKGRRKGSYVSKEVKDALILYLEVGGNRKEVSRQTGISQMTLYRWSKRYNWKEKLKNIDEEISKAVADDVLQRIKRKILMESPF